MKQLISGNKRIVLIVFLLGFSTLSWADVITDLNQTGLTLVTKAKLNTAYANRAMAIIHTAMYEASNAITQRYQNSHLSVKGHTNASVEAAIISASYQTMLVLMPQQNKQIEQAYQDAIDNISPSKNKELGINIGLLAAQSVLAHRKTDWYPFKDTYKPSTQGGVYVPTTLPAVSYWSQRTPWFLSSAKQFRADPPPSLSSDIWTEDFNEVKQLGSLNSTTRTQEQSDIAKFWQATLPPIYHGIIRSVANQPNRDVTQNARLFAASTRAIDDALIAVFEAKYHYQFWRPITAIRNADIDGNADTLLDESWLPFIPTPMHPEYPCAHCVVAATLGNVLKVDLGNGPTPTLITQSTTAGDVQRSWTDIDVFIDEVSNARIYDGVHYRSSTDAGNKMGKNIADLAVKTYYGNEN